MDDFTLTRSRRNEITAMLTQAGLHVSHFTISPMDYEFYSDGMEFSEKFKCDSIKHKQENYYFDFFTRNGSTYNPEFRPGFGNVVEKRSVADWNSLISLFSEWILLIKEELGQPDLWSIFEEMDDMETMASMADQSTEDEKTMLTEEQQQEFENRISYLEKHLLENKNIDPNKIESFKDDLDYLKRSSKRLNIKDLKNVVISTAIHIVYNIVIDEAKRNAVFSLIIGVLGHIPHFKALPF
jgi:hypothetical protein